MKSATTFTFFMLFNLVLPTGLLAQHFEVSNDSSKSSIDISGQFNGADIQLPAVKKLPEFPGGKKAWQDFLRSNINVKVPLANGAVPGTYNVIIWFVVTNDGKISRIGADSHCGFGLEIELIRCIRKSSDWMPAETSSGKKVSFILRSLVTFTIKQNDVEISPGVILVNS